MMRQHIVDSIQRAKQASSCRDTACAGVVHLVQHVMRRVHLGLEVLRVRQLANATKRSKSVLLSFAIFPLDSHDGAVKLIVDILHAVVRLRSTV